MSIRGFNPTHISNEKIEARYFLYYINYSWTPYTSKISYYADDVPGAEGDTWFLHNPRWDNIKSSINFVRNDMIKVNIGDDLFAQDIIKTYETAISGYTLVGFSTTIPTSTTPFNLIRKSWKLINGDILKDGNKKYVNIYCLLMPNNLTISRGDVDTGGIPETPLPQGNTLGVSFDYIQKVPSSFFILAPLGGSSYNGIPWVGTYQVAYNPETGEAWDDVSPADETWFSIKFGPYKNASITANHGSYANGNCIVTVYNSPNDNSSIYQKIELERKGKTSTSIGTFTSDQENYHYRLYVYGTSDGAHNIPFICCNIIFNIAFSSPKKWNET